MVFSTLHLLSRFGWTLALCLAVGFWIVPSFAPGAEKDQKQEVELPSELRGAKVYRLPEETRPGVPAENPVIYKSLSYEDINLDRLALKLSLSIKPVDRAATVRKIYFQDIRANGVPIHVETFDQEFKLSKKEAVDLPAPLECTIVFAEVESVEPIREIVNQDRIRITGQSFIEVKLNPLEKLALRAKRVVLPVEVSEEVPLQMFSGSPLLQMAAGKILDTLADPSSGAAIALAKEHLARMTVDRTLDSQARKSLFLIRSEYALRDPKSGASEKLGQSGTGFMISADGKLLTAKRVVEPWKFDPQIVLLMTRDHLEVDAKTVRLIAWPAEARLLAADGSPETQSAFDSEKQTLRVLATAPDRMENQDYQDPDSGERTGLRLHAGGENDVAVLQLSGESFQPLTLAAGGEALPPDGRTALLSFPYGLSRPQAVPSLFWVKANVEGNMLSIDRALNPGETGAPLLTPEGKAVGLCTNSSACVPIAAASKLIP
jgi:S1-C subfamily serine protease